jgi:hypothetical protein
LNVFPTVGVGSEGHFLSREVRQTRAGGVEQRGHGEFRDDTLECETGAGAQFCPRLHEGCPGPISDVRLRIHEESSLGEDGRGRIAGTIPTEII